MEDFKNNENELHSTKENVTNKQNENDFERIEEVKKQVFTNENQSVEDLSNEDVYIQKTVRVTTTTTETTHTETTDDSEFKRQMFDELKSEKKQSEDKQNEQANEKATASGVFFGGINNNDATETAEQNTSETTEEEDEDTERSINVWWYVLGGVAALIIIILLFFAFNPNAWLALTKNKKAKIEKQETYVEETDTMSAQDMLPPLHNTQQADTLAKTTNDVDSSTKKISIPKQMSDKWGLKLPCFIISYASLSTEARAKKVSADLKAKNYKAGYYWIPDFSAGGKELYKVYIGPFNTRDEAKKILPDIKKKNKEAYIWEIEET